MKLIPTAPTDRTRLLISHKIIVDFNDVAALGAGTSGTITLFPRTGNFPAGTTVRFAGFVLTTPFDSSDAAINSLTVQVGDTATANRYLAATETHVDGTEILNSLSALAGAETAADALKVTFTVSGGASPTLAETTVGQIEFHILVIDQNDAKRIGGLM